MENAPLQLSQEFNDVIDAVEKNNRPVFVTGKAGTGKSTLLQLLRSATRKKNVVLAPTGIAALNVQGQTIHSFFGFPPKLFESHDIKKRYAFIKLYQNLELLIIDEISMVRADMLDHIDYFLRLHRNKPQPFGGVQVVFFGDLFQLPPVVASQEERFFLEQRYESPYFFSAHVIRNREIELETFELSKVYRQENPRFLNLLNSVRLNRADMDDLHLLNSRTQQEPEPGESYITLAARNSRVDTINKKELEKIPYPGRIYKAEVKGQFSPQVYPAEELLALKLGAQVMFIKNDTKKEYVNGTLGKILGLEENAIKVEVTEAGERKIIEVERASWEIIRYVVSKEDPNKIDSETTGTYVQFPLRLAWAVTIHKAQGKTFDRVIIDMDTGAFEHGQTYVALSRCRTLEGIVLTKAIQPKDIITDERIVDFHLANR